MLSRFFQLFTLWKIPLTDPSSHMTFPHIGHTGIRGIHIAPNYISLLGTGSLQHLTGRQHCLVIAEMCCWWGEFWQRWTKFWPLFLYLLFPHNYRGSSFFCASLPLFYCFHCYFCICHLHPLCTLVLPTNSNCHLVNFAKVGLCKHCQKVLFQENTPSRCSDTYLPLCLSWMFLPLHYHCFLNSDGFRTNIMVQWLTPNGIIE